MNETCHTKSMIHVKLKELKLRIRCRNAHSKTQCCPPLAQAVMAIYPDAKPTIGPAIDRGFYYDFAMETITESDLKPIQKKMQEMQEKISQLSELNSMTVN